MKTTESWSYELRFDHLLKPGRGYAFPCNADGLVDINALSDRARDNYLYARTLIGREMAMPIVRASSTSCDTAVPHSGR